MESTELLNKLVAIDEDRNLGKRGAREDMLRLAHDLVSSLEITSEMIQRTCWAEPAQLWCMRTAIDLKLFEKLSEANGQPLPVEDLAKSTGADPVLLNRMLKHLCAVHIVSETKAGFYQSTERSNELTKPKYRDGLIYNFDVVGKSWSGLPKFLSKTEYRNPTNPVDGPFQYAHDTKSHFWPWLQENPPYVQYFANYMQGYREGKTSWMDKGCYPIQENLLNNLDGQVALVDVGGGKGHDLMALKAAYPEFAGRLILQDKPEVIEEAKDTIDKDVEAMVHDIFEDQNIKGAKAYLLHSVLHGYSDDDAVKALTKLKAASKPGYSRILINELAVPDENAAWPYTSMDLLMMALGSVRERTEADWRRLAEEAGLKVKKIWSFGHGSESLVELMLP